MRRTSSRDSAEHAGDHRAFLEATLPHLDTVHRIARHLCADRWDADDLVQETYLRAFAAFGGHRGDNTRAWLATICVNAARSEGRRRARRPAEILGMDAEPLVTGPDDVAEQALGSVQRAEISRALAELPEEQRISILLMDVAGFTAAEVAEMRGCGRGTVLSRVFRGRQKLARMLEDLRVDDGAEHGKA